jgi:hypothetical protein
MRTARLDRDTADRLLAGRVAPDDAPPGYADLARLVSEVRAAAAPRELIRMSEDVEAAAAIRARGRAPTSARPARPRSRFGRVRGVVLVTAGTVVATSGLAAAGVLPDPVQDVVSDVLSRVGITVPAGDGDRDGGEPPAGPGSSVSPVAVVPERPVVGEPASIPTLQRERPGEPAVEPGTGQVGGTSTGPPSDTPANGPPEHAGPPEDTPGTGPPEHVGNGSPPGNGPPEHVGNGSPADPGNGPPADTPGNGPPADPGGGQGMPPPGQGNGSRAS